MSKMLSVLVAALALSQSQAFAQTSRVKCFERKAPQYFVVIALDDAGRILKATPKKQVLSDNHARSPFSYLSADLEESGFESVRTMRAPNGFSIVTFISTADAVSIGVSKDRSRGFYTYQDLGSGNGNSRKDLVCQPSR